MQFFLYNHCVCPDAFYFTVVKMHINVANTLASGYYCWSAWVGRSNPSVCLSATRKIHCSNLVWGMTLELYKWYGLWFWGWNVKDRVRVNSNRLRCGFDSNSYERLLVVYGLENVTKRVARDSKTVSKERWKQLVACSQPTSAVGSLLCTYVVVLITN